MKKLNLIIYTPNGKKYNEEVDFVQVHTDKAFLGILPGHTDLVSDVIISKLIVRRNGRDYPYAIGEGVLSVEKDTVKLLVSSLEHKDEIDIDRAVAAKERAEKRLASIEEGIDLDRARKAYARALNRIDIYNDLK